MDLQPRRGVAMPPTVFIPIRSYDDDVLSLLEEELEEEVCGEEEEEEFNEALLRSIDCPWLSSPDHDYPNEDVLPRPEFVDIEDKAYFIPRSNYDGDFLFVLEEEAEGEVCREEEEKEFKESLRRSMDRPLLSPPDYGYPDEEGVPRPNFILIEQMAYFIFFLRVKWPTSSTATMPLLPPVTPGNPTSKAESRSRSAPLPHRWSPTTVSTPPHTPTQTSSPIH
jgi:hypothetical protein